MSTPQLYKDDLLDPISPDQPAGTDLRWTPEWDRIKEARRADDDLESGRWVKKERKTADWVQVQELTTAMLRERSKDLQLVMWLTEANIRLHGFAGLRDGLRISRELMVRYWDKGLYPSMEDGPEDRSGPFEWLSNKLVDSITVIPITDRADQGQDYSFIDLEDARRVGSEASCRTPDGEIDPRKKKNYEQAIAEGHVSMEMFDRGVKATSRAAYEDLNADIEEAHDEYKALEKVIDEKFGDLAPNMSSFRSALSDIKQAVTTIVEQKRLAEPDAPAPNPQTNMENPPSQNPTGPADPVVVRFPLTLSTAAGNQTVTGGSWQDAEMLIRSGEVDKGLAQMTELAARETNGRDRFHRKLLLAEVCLVSKRERLARLILVELAEQIDKLQLEQWESSELISSVWTRLYKLYKQGTDTSDHDRASKLYERLCRLDPWQALNCHE
jgi:type VI secretion system protein ImpA